jgi:hypothetical protein
VSLPRTQGGSDDPAGPGVEAEEGQSGLIATAPENELRGLDAQNPQTDRPRWPIYLPEQFDNAGDAPRIGVHLLYDAHGVIEKLDAVLHSHGLTDIRRSRRADY